jgi:polyhydroxyalkanoate synthesis regulator phasin
MRPGEPGSTEEVILATREAKDDGDKKGPRQKVGDGIRQGIGVLSAFKDALEETINEARERGDLSTDRAKEVMKGALERAQTAASGARERLDFVNQSELEALQAAVEELKQRVGALEAKAFGASEEEGTGP